MKQAADPQVVMNALEKTLAQELAELQKQEISSGQSPNNHVIGYCQYGSVLNPPLYPKA